MRKFLSRYEHESIVVLNHNLKLDDLTAFSPTQTEQGKVARVFVPLEDLEILLKS